MNKLVFVDAILEAILGGVLVVGSLAGWLSGDDFGTTTTALTIVGVALLLFAAGLALLAARDATGRFTVLALSLGNEAVAFALVIWVLVGSGFTIAGTTLVWLAMAALAVLSAFQLRAVVHGRRAVASRTTRRGSIAG